MSEGKGVQDPWHLPKPELHLSRWKLNGLSHGTAKAKRRDSQVPASGAVGSCPVLPMAGQASPHPRGSKDTAHKVRLQRLDRVTPLGGPLQGDLRAGQGPEPGGSRLTAEVGRADQTGAQAPEGPREGRGGVPPRPAAGATRGVCAGYLLAPRPSGKPQRGTVQPAHSFRGLTWSTLSML